MSLKQIFGLQESPRVKNNLAPLNFTEDSLSNTYKTIDKLGLDPTSFYKLNSNHLRSDDFKNSHDGLHMVFAGCSITAGEGLLLDYTWPKIVYDKISSEQKVSGYYNIAQPGSSPIDVIEQIITYTGEFGNPDVIFVNLPDIDREKRYYKDTDAPIQEIESVATGMQIYGYYHRLVNICKLNNIKLVAFTWEDIFAPTKTLNLRHEFQNLGYVTKEDTQKYLFDFEQAHKDHELKDYFYVAFDTDGSPESGHPGVAYHSLYADIAYNMYRRIK